MKFFLLLTLLAGCATPYQPKGFRGGYEDYLINETKHTYGIRVTGNSHTSMPTLQEHARRRAGELCSAAGFKSFTVLENKLDCAARVLIIAGGCEQDIVLTTIQCQ